MISTTRYLPFGKVKTQWAILQSMSSSIIVSLTLKLISKTLIFTTLFPPLMIPWVQKWSGESKLNDPNYYGVSNSSGPHAHGMKGVVNFKWNKLALNLHGAWFSRAPSSMIIQDHLQSDSCKLGLRKFMEQNLTLCQRSHL